jgi:hypothetical protein
MNKFILCLTLLAASCSGQKISNQKVQYIKKYKQAKSYQAQGRNEVSCEIYKELEKDKTFLLQDLLTLKKLETCALTNQELEVIWKDKELTKKHYLYEYYLLASYKQSLLLENYSKLLEYGTLYNDYLKTKKEREEFATELHKTISKLPQKNLIQKARDNLYKYKARLIKNPSPEQYYDVARDFERVRSFNKARSYYLKAILNGEVPVKTKIMSYYRRAMTYKLKRDNVTFSRMLHKM